MSIHSSKNMVPLFTQKLQFLHTTCVVQCSAVERYKLSTSFLASPPCLARLPKILCCTELKMISSLQVKMFVNVYGTNWKLI